MNLIEQLGGYDEAKKHLDSCWCDDDNKVYLLGELLKYRRENNIFEVGDLVLRSDGFSNVLGITKTDGDYADLIRRVDGEPRWSRFKLTEIHHATDAEIRAGHRLELEILNDHDIPPNTTILER